MKPLKSRILSALLAFVAALALLIPAASAAVSIGTGITPIADSGWWTTRMTASGQPYSYRPPVAAGKHLFCMDLGYSYRHSTASFLNSYTYVSATGKDADDVWKQAVAGTGLGEMDAATQENVKWMMSYVLTRLDMEGALSMAVQTYIWDNQSDKSAGGDPSGDIDAGGFANQSTYDVYVDYYNWMLNTKTAEDAELLAQVQAYAEQGIQASIVEDESSKWAVLATSSVSGRQAFFAYNSTRKVETKQQPSPGQPDIPTLPDQPVAGDGTIMFRKVAAGTTQGLDGAVYNIYRDGQIIGSQVTSGGGYIKVEGITTGLYSFVERCAPIGYALDPTPHSVYVDVTDGGKEYTVTAEDEKLPGMRIVKTDAQTCAPVPGTVFSIKSVTGSFSTSVTTGTDGTASLFDLDVGVYVVKEESVPEPYIVSHTEQTVALRPGKTSEVAFQNYQKPGLEILKKNIANGGPIPGVTFQIRQIGGSFSTSATTDAQGRIFLENIPAGSYKVVETAVPDHVIPGDVPQTVALEAGGVATVTFFNALKPTLTIKKVDSITGDPIQGVKFQLWRGSDNTSTGELNDLGVFYTNERGEIVLENAESGWYKVTELEPADGYELPKNPSREFYLKGGESKTVVFENVPLSALVVWKYDSVTGEAVEGAVFQIKYLNGNSGTGGTVIGAYKTSKNGSFTVTGLKKGTYVVEELASDSGHVIDTAPQTVYISGEEQNVVELFFGNSPKGALLIKKIDSATREPLSDVEFLVTLADGSLVGDANGKFVTDSAGAILIDGIDPGTTLVVKETRTREGYILDDVPQTAQIKAGQTVTLEFRNQPTGGLIIHKLDSVTKQPLAGVQFKVTYADGQVVDAEGGKLSSNGLYWTDSEGQIRISGITGTLAVTEVQTLPGYTIDENTRSQTVVVNPSDTQELTFYNKPLSGLLIHKIDSATKKGIPGVTFLVYDGNHNPIDQITTDQNGYAYLDVLDFSGRLYLRELENKGYIVDTQLKTVYIKPGETTEVTWENTPITGQIQIVKKSADYNSTNGLPAGTLLEGAVFEIYDRAGNLVDTIRSDSRGLAVSRQLPLGRYTLREVQAPANYGVNDTELTAYLEHEGQITRFEVTNKSLSTGVSITKTGPKEIMSGQPMRYVFSDIANRSNVRLDSFYFRDTLPAEVRLDSVVTGAWNFPGTYKITYRVNGGEYRTLADTLSTAKNYTLDASPTALGLAANERITEVMFVFGQAPAGFAQVEKPMLNCTAAASISADSFVNVADVGGVYNGTWVQAISRWVTTVYKPAKPQTLPRTGY